MFGSVLSKNMIDDWINDTVWDEILSKRMDTMAFSTARTDSSNSVNQYCGKCGKPMWYIGDIYGDPKDILCQCNIKSETYTYSNYGTNEKQILDDLEEIKKLLTKLLEKG